MALTTSDLHYRSSAVVVPTFRKPKPLLPPTPRVYTRDFGKRILELWREEMDASKPRLCMRQKIHVSGGETDQDLFRKLPLADVWPDAELVQVWAYLYANKKLRIPSSWESTMATFHTELLDSVPWLLTMSLPNMAAPAVFLMGLV